MARVGQNEFVASVNEVECVDCHQQFNLGLQDYYARLCPDCRSEVEG